jgi:hypothetical protein
MKRLYLIILLAICAALKFPAESLFAQLGPNRPSEVITLITATGDSCSVDADAHPVNIQVLPDGALAQFKIPQGQVFVVTGTCFSASGGSATNRAKQVILFGAKPPAAFAPLFFTIVLTADTALGQLGGGTSTIPNAVVKAGFDICVKGSEINGSPANASALVYGFLAKDQ